MNDEFSLLICKPECNRLNKIQKAFLDACLYAYVEPFTTHKEEIYLSYLQAREMWENSVSKFYWNNEFYIHMSSGTSYVYILSGSNTANGAKKIIREVMSEAINIISFNNQRGFTLDLIHGSDPGSFSRENEILNLNK